jgi:hypothetical protein
MPLFDLSAIPQLERLCDEMTQIRLNTFRIAVALERLIAIPEQPPIKRAGLEALGTYGEQEQPESPEEMRERLTAMGMTDLDVERLIVDRIFGKEGEA